MIPYDLDPSLYAAEPGKPMFDDGFSPPENADADAADVSPQTARDDEPRADVEPGLGPKSLF